MMVRFSSYVFFTGEPSPKVTCGILVEIGLWLGAGNGWVGETIAGVQGHYSGS